MESPRKGKRAMMHTTAAIESKRRKIVQEFYETEKAYLEGLEMIYSVSTIHLLKPLIDTYNPNSLALSYAYS